ncbi:PucR family transcriptional regulator [Dactylosporangium sp. NBC_01737]|uniref:PucR family transcriptional regulator n=1 Tax=Dactylosporangium sp. NBC_01737 TaxID=2975959 RepID=UPI002E0DA0E7|nr:PucR family transcriptional regulator [Dactylosporangium sp. NBC_01737]
MRPQASLGRVLDDLGATLLELVHGDPDHDPRHAAAIGGVVIHDPLDEPVLPQHALVLGVGVGDAAQTARLLRALGRQEAVGLVVRAPAPTGPDLAAAAAESGVALLGLTRGASWAQLAALLRSLLAEGDVGDAGPQTLGGVPAGDLFALANAIAALLDAPVTIEDRSSRVLAYSGRQDEADRSRIETILGRQVPERYARHLTDRGVFRDLYRSDQPVYVEPGGDDFLVPRVAVAVRAGDEVLGSIWAAVRRPPNLDRMQALRDAARVVALHMLRIRAGADVERRLRTDLLSTALEGGPGALDALTRLGLADRPVAVLGLALLVPDSAEDAEGSASVDAGLATERQRLADALAMHLGAVHPRSAAALIGDVVYGLVPVTRGRADGEQRAARIATDFLDRVGERTPPSPASARSRRTWPGLPRRGPGPTGRCGSCAPAAAPDAGSPGWPTCTWRRCCWIWPTWCRRAATGPAARSRACSTTTPGTTRTSSTRCGRGWTRSVTRSPPRPRCTSTRTRSGTGCAA